MKALLIVFAVLLLLLTLLSTFGGSIRPGEPFYQPESPDYVPEKFQQPMMPPSEPFQDQGIPDYPTMSSSPERFKQPTREYFYEPTAPTMQAPSMPQLPPPPPPMPVMVPQQEMMPPPPPPPMMTPSMGLSEAFTIEPFEEEGKNMYAGF